jgi:hypothetical protein
MLFLQAAGHAACGILTCFCKIITGQSTFITRFRINHGLQNTYKFVIFEEDEFYC